MGHCGYYQRFIYMYAMIAIPLYGLLAIFIWNEECEKSFQKFHGRHIATVLKTRYSVSLMRMIWMRTDKLKAKDSTSHVFSLERHDLFCAVGAEQSLVVAVEPVEGLLQRRVPRRQDSMPIAQTE